jgi:hypothetical protein
MNWCSSKGEAIVMMSYIVVLSIALAMFSMKKDVG